MTPEQVATLRELWPSELGIRDLARAVGCRSTTVSRTGKQLGLGPRTAAALAGRKRWGQSWQASLPARQEARAATRAKPSKQMTDRQIIEAYAGRRYEDDPAAAREPRSFWRARGSYANSLMGCAAAMAEGA